MKARIWVTATVFPVLSAACGGGVRTAQTGEVPTPTPAASIASPTPTPTATANPEASAIFVASLSGNDGNDGSRHSPLRTVAAAIRAAQARGFHDLYLFGGDEGAFAEIVDVADGVNMHGSLCKDANDLQPNHDECPTVISGGSPTFIAQGIRTATLVENVDLAGAPAVQNGAAAADTFFSVDGIGCVGRGNAPTRFTRCTPAADDQGRTVPQSAVGATVLDSSALTLRGVHVSAGNAADGLAGVGGTKGTDGAAGTSGGAGALGYHSGVAGTAGVNAACPEANGGAGGAGGRWYWDGKTMLLGKNSTTPQLVYTSVYSGDAGTAAVSADATNGAGGLPGASDPLAQKGSAGKNGSNGVDGAAGTSGALGDLHVDPATLVAGNGAAGMRGHAGVGGGGGAGGAPASIELFSSSSSKESSGIYAVSYFGGTATSSTSATALHDVGETAGGAGAGGGAAGCGGFGGTGGQGGAASVALYVVNSQLSVLDSSIASGKGGNGGAGGVGGAGGLGKQGGVGGLGGFVQKGQVSGNYSDGGNGSVFQVVSINASTSVSDTQRNSPSEGGAGGAGGFGGKGGAGGNGGAGAGGATIGVLRVGGATAVNLSATTTVTVGQPGVALGTTTAGLAAADYSL